MQHLRRDKYQKKVVEYWVDVRTTGLREQESSDRLDEIIRGEGSAPDSFEMGGFGDAPLADVAGEPDDGSSSDDDDEDGKKKKKSPKGAKGFQRERALEATLLLSSAKLFMMRSPHPCLKVCRLQAVENLGEVMANVLRTQGKVKATVDKLEKVKGGEKHLGNNPSAVSVAQRRNLVPTNT